jgi:two-component system nitrate/nitrite response regulator NarL
MTMREGQPKGVVVCDSQPLAIEGLRSLLGSTTDLKFAGAMTTLAATLELVRSTRPSVVLVDKSFGATTVLDFARTLRNYSNAAVAVWGVSTTNAEALRFLQGGVQGVLRRTSDTDALLSCLRTVAAGQTWMEDTLIAEASPRSQDRRASLTAREHEVVKLVERGLKNRDIADNLGIRTGTVKIHLKHIFEKTGCRGRYGLALTCLHEKGILTLQPM